MSFSRSEQKGSVAGRLRPIRARANTAEGATGIGWTPSPELEETQKVPTQELKPGSPLEMETEGKLVAGAVAVKEDPARKPRFAATAHPDLPQSQTENVLAAAEKAPSTAEYSGLSTSAN